MLTLSLPKHQGTNLRAVSLNLLFDATAEERIPLMTSCLQYYMPDVIGFQEVNSLLHKKFIPLLPSLGYSVTTAWPDPDNMLESEKSSLCKKYPTLNHFPVAYRTDIFEEVESRFAMYHTTWTYTKGFTSAVLRNKQTGKMLAIVNTHAALVISIYKIEGATNSGLGAKWREDNARELLEEKQRIVNAYGDIPVIFTGDFNGPEGEKYYDAILESGMVNTKYAASVSASLNIASFHGRPGNPPAEGGVPIDHIFVSEGTPVAVHSIETRKEVLDATDHCLVYADLTV